jgi:Methyltransferase domain/Glycosyl transferase family 2
VSSLTVLLPTLGRPTLPRMLQSLADQEWAEEDELLLVSDDRHDWCHTVFQASGLPGRHVATFGPTGDWGHTQRNWFMPCSRGNWLWHIDDDDVVLPGALATIRAALKASQGSLHLFRFASADGSLYWNSPGVRNGVYGTPCLVHPREIPLGTWQPCYGGDQAFVHETLRLNPGLPVLWHEDLLYYQVHAGQAHLRLDQCFAETMDRLHGQLPSWRLVPAKREWVDLARYGGPGGRGDCQSGWHRLAAQLFRGQEVLDVGAGLGEVRKRFRGQAKRFVTQDPAPGLAVDFHEPVAHLPEKAYDAVTCFDVLEHVEDDHGFIRDLLRLARRAVFFTTPNWRVSRAGNPAHVREYTPTQIAGLLLPLGVTTFRVGDSQGLAPRRVSLDEFLTAQVPHLAILLEHPDPERP